jgi:glycosyltransferase involved in cell wall biosynthesis
MELRRHMFPISYGDIESGRMTPLTRRALEFFRTADIFVFHFPLPYPLFEAIALVERGVAIVDYHGVTPARFWESEGRENFFKAVRRQMRFIGNADYAIAHSEFTRDELLRTATLAPERVYQMAYAVPLERFRPGPRPEALLARYGLAHDQPLLLYVGRMAANKRIDDLVRALVLVRAEFPDAALLLVGDDRLAAYAPVADQARRLARELEVAEAVIFAGMVPDEELVAHYQLADLFVTASVHEGFCIPVLEAMACGLPVVGAHATALPETIGEGGLTFRPQDARDLADKVLALLSTRPSRGRRQVPADDDGV